MKIWAPLFRDFEFLGSIFLINLFINFQDFKSKNSRVEGDPGVLAQKGWKMCNQRPSISPITPLKNLGDENLGASFSRFWSFWVIFLHEFIHNFSRFQIQKFQSGGWSRCFGEKVMNFLSVTDPDLPKKVTQKFGRWKFGRLFFEILKFLGHFSPWIYS